MNQRLPGQAVLPPFSRTLAALLVLVLLTGSGCQRSSDTDHLAFQAFGTLIDLTLYPAGKYDLASIEPALRSFLDALHQDWHAWEPGMLTETNRQLRSGQPFTPDPSLLPLIEAGLDFEQRSGGLFNPAMGGLFAAWGFHDPDPRGPPPAPDIIHRLLEDAPRMQDIRLYPGATPQDATLHTDNPAVQLDFGGLAKGLVVAKALELLQEKGIERAIFNAGGDLMTLGKPPRRPWRIGVRDPLTAGILGSLALHDGEALFSSGSYERGYEWEGERIHHVLDPRNGYPSRGILGVTILDTDPVRADASATAIMIAGPEHWPELANRLGVKHVLVVLDNGDLEMTPALFERMERLVERPARRRPLPSRDPAVQEGIPE